MKEYLVKNFTNFILKESAGGFISKITVKSKHSNLKIVIFTNRIDVYINHPNYSNLLFWFRLNEDSKFETTYPVTEKFVLNEIIKIFDTTTKVVYDDGDDVYSFGPEGLDKIKEEPIFKKWLHINRGIIAGSKFNF